MLHEVIIAIIVWVDVVIMIGLWLASHGEL
jgi:hypothetical protein